MRNREVSEVDVATFDVGNQQLCEMCYHIRDISQIFVAELICSCHLYEVMDFLAHHDMVRWFCVLPITSIS